MLKNIIAPVQTWLLTQKRCVGCGMPLAKASVVRGKNGEVLRCKCKRMYIHDSVSGVYKRALLSDI